MKIKYEFVTGETVEIEVEENWAELMVGMDMKEYSNDHKETRRHRSISVLGDEGSWLSDERPKTFLECSGIRVSDDDERFEKAYSSLTDKQKALYDEVYVRGLKLKEYAERAGISPAAATKMNKNIIKKFEEIFKKG